MDNQKFQAIIRRLLILTKKDKLNWKTTANSVKYLLALDDSSITIINLGDSITFEFKNEKGETVESESVYLNSEDQYANRSVKLYDLVRRKALNSDKTIDRILEQLNPDSIAA